MARNGLLCADVPLRNYSINQSTANSVNFTTLSAASQAARATVSLDSTRAHQHDVEHASKYVRILPFVQGLPEYIYLVLYIMFRLSVGVFH